MRSRTAALAANIAFAGGISPVTIHDGTPEDVKRETRAAIETFAPHGGYIVMDGNNIAPDSPLENINAMHEAAVVVDFYFFVSNLKSVKNGHIRHPPQFVSMSSLI